MEKYSNNKSKSGSSITNFTYELHNWRTNIYKVGTSSEKSYMNINIILEIEIST